MPDLTHIKQIQLSDGNHDIDAKYWDGHQWSDLGTPLKFLGSAVEVQPTAGRYVKAVVNAEKTYYIPLTSTGEATEVSPEKGDMFIDMETGKEYICVLEGPDPGEFQWELLGDQNNYQVIGKTLTTSTPSVNATSSAGGQTITTTSDGAHTATGTGTGSVVITTKEAPTVTGSEGAGESAVTSAAGSATIQGSSFSFAGTTATLTGTFTVSGIAMSDHASQTLTASGSQTISGHTHTVNAAKATVTVITDLSTTAEAGAHTHTVSIDSHSHGDDVSASNITAYTAPSMTTINFTANELQTLTSKNYGFSSSTSDVMSSPTVSDAGVLSWTLNAASSQDALSAGSQASLTGGAFSAGTLTYSGVTAAGSKSAATLTGTAASAGAHTHDVDPAETATLTYMTGATLSEAGGVTVNGSNFSVVLPTLTHTQSGEASVDVSLSYKPAGTIGGSASIEAHQHNYTAPKAHTHSITPVTATQTATVEMEVSVAVAAHTHSVTVASHTHDLGNHTHNVTTSNN